MLICHSKLAEESERERPFGCAQGDRIAAQGDRIAALGDRTAVQGDRIVN